MTYDFSTASSRKTNFVAPLLTHEGALNVNAAVNSYLGAGVPADKIVLGVRFVGTGWRGVASTNDGLYQADAGAAPGTRDLPRAAPSGSFGYRDIEDNYLPSYTRRWDREGQVPWLYNADGDHDQLRGSGVADCEGELCPIQPARRRHDLGTGCR